LPPESFYELPARVPVRPPGTVLRALRLKSPPESERWAVLYHSRSAAGGDVIVSGVAAVPSGRPPPGGFPIVAFGHGTTGFTDRAAPSRSGMTGTPIGLRELFRLLVPRGFAVAVSDYEGLGTSGPLQYVVGPSVAHSVLDAARAARRLEPGRVDTRLAVVGHSLGGHAALWSAEVAAGYAPELDLRGVVASAPGANLPAILERYDFSPETMLNVLRLLGAWNSIYRVPLRPTLTDAGLRDVDLVMADRPGEIDPSAEPFRRPPAANSRLMSLAARNTPGAGPASAPILMLVGTADRQVPPSTNLSLAQRLRQVGDRVRLRVLPGADHNGTLLDRGNEILRFLRGRLAAR
jgi:alpha-beta hydrolase superfamily lysophospholipase